jgi:hypothetical protein
VVLLAARLDRRRSCSVSEGSGSSRGSGRSFTVPAREIPRRVRRYSAGGTTSYVVGVATSRGVIITPAMVSLNNVAIRSGADGFS